MKPDGSRVVRQIGWMQGRRTAAYLDGMLRSSDAADADLSGNPKGRRPFARRLRRLSSMMPPASYPPRSWAATKIPGVATASGFIRVPTGNKALVHIRKKLLFCVFGAVCLLIFVYGCAMMAKPMSDGEVLYRAKCSSCHNIIAPSSYGKEDWQLYLDKYGEKMTNQEKRAILEYLVNAE